MKSLAAAAAAVLVLLSPLRTARAVAARLPAVRRYDVIVTGGTPAGIAAAIEAARRGMHVALITRGRTLGGELTLGMLTQWDLQDAPDGRDIQSELFHEFYSALPDGFDPRHAARYFRRRIEREHNITWYPDAGAIDVYGTRANGTRRLSSLAFDRDRKPLHVSGTCFIDATDDGDLAAAAGADYDIGEQDKGIDLAMQPATLIFTLAGVDWSQVNPQGGDQSAGYGTVVRSYRPLSPRAAVPDMNLQLNRDGTVMVNAIDIFGVDGRSAASRAKARRIAVAESEAFTRFLRVHLDGFAHARIAAFAPQLYIRETRHVRGLTWIGERSIWDGERPRDSVVLAAYPLDVHPVRAGAGGGDGWAEVPHEYGIPLRALVVYGFRNLAIVGPAISATHVAEGSVRVLPTTIGEGEAMGRTCARSVRTGYDLPALAHRMLDGPGA